MLNNSLGFRNFIFSLMLEIVKPEYQVNRLSVKELKGIMFFFFSYNTKQLNRVY